MSHRSRIASALLGSAQQPAVRDFLFKQSGNAREASTGPAITPNAALPFYKGEISHAVAIATNVNTEPSVLAKFSKDPRVSVREAVRDNPSTPYDARVAVVHWSVKRDKEDSLDTALAYLEPADLADVIRTADEGRIQLRLYPTTLKMIARKLATEPEYVKELPALRVYGLTAELAQLVLTGHLETVTIAELLERDENSSYPALSELVGNATALTVDLANAWMTAANQRAAITVNGPAGMVDPDAVELLAGGRPEHLQAAIVNGLSEVRIREELATGDSGTLAAVIAGASDRKYSVATERALVERFIALGGSPSWATGRAWHYMHEPVVAILAVVRAELPHQLLVELLRHGSMPATSMWLAPKAGVFPLDVNRPRPEVLGPLVEQPGQALIGRVPVARAYGHRQQDQPAEANTWHTLNSQLLQATANAPQLAAVVAQALDTHLVKQLSGDLAARALFPLLTAALAEDTEAWEMFLTLAGDWSDGFQALLDSVPALLGRRVLQPEPETTTEPETTPSLQLQVV